MFFPGKTLARGVFVAFLIVAFVVGLFSIADYARGQSLQAKWEAVAKQRAGHDPVQWWLSRNLNADKTHQNIFPGVDLTYIYDDSGLHANLALAPRTKLESIQFQFDDLQSLSVDGNGEAFVQTAFGNFRLTAPTFSQELNDQQIPLSGGYQQTVKGTLGFWSGFYEVNRPLQIRFSMELIQQKGTILNPNATQAVNVTATKTDALAIDVDGDTKADPGDTLQYTVVVANSGDTDATGVQFNDTIDANTTLVVGSVDTTPLAFPDSFNAVGNVRIQVPSGSGLIINDTEPDGTGGLTLTAETKLSANNGNVTINADGSFTYNPFPGFEGTDTFTYTLNDGEGNTDTGTATIIVSGMIWFINNTSTPPGDGRLTNPFSSIANFNTTAADQAGDNIFVFESATGYTGPLTLLNNQRLIGQDSTSSLSTITGITPPAFSDAFPITNSGNGTFANITSAANGVDLAQNNTLNGFRIGNSLNAVNGTAFGTLTVADVLINTNGRALNLDNGTAAGTGFISTSSSGGTNNVTLTSIGGTLNLGSGALSGATSHAFNANQGPGSINYSGTINNTTARSVSVTNKFAGTVAFSGAVSGTSQGVVITGNSGTATINFTGGMNLSTGTNAAFTATGGGTVNATQNNTSIVNTLTTTTGTALNVANTTIGASGLTFRSISANGGANGIILNNTGSGSFSIVGNGGVCTEATPTCTGGRIQNTTGADDSSTTPIGTGIVLNNVSNISLALIRINDHSNYGIRGISVNGFTLNNSLVDGVNGTNVNTPFNDGSLLFFGATGTSSGMTGTCSITNSTIRGGFQRNIAIDNSVGTLNLTVNNSTIKNTSNAVGDDGLFIEADTNATVNATITNNTFAAHGGDHFNFSLVNNAVASLTMTGNALSGGHPVGLGQGIFVFGATFNGTLTYNISNNGTVAVPFTGNRQGGAIHVNKGSGTGTFSGRIENNVIGDPAIVGSGSSEAFGIIVSARGAGGSHTTLINNNQVRQYFDRGIVTEAGEGAAALNATITNNTVSNFADAINSLHGIHSDNGILAGDTNSVCIDIRANSVATAGNEAQGGADIRLRKGSQAGLSVRLPGLVGNTSTDADNLITANNPTATTVTVTGAGYAGGAACAQPAFAMSQPVHENVVAESIASSQIEIPEKNTFVSEADSLRKLSNNVVSANIRSTQKQLMPTFAQVSNNADNLQQRQIESPLSGETINLSIGTLPFGKSITVKFRAIVNSPFPQGVGTVCNQSTISGGNFSSVLSDDPDVVGATDPTCTTLAQANLSVTKTDSPDPVAVGNNITYTINFINNGPDGANNVSVTDPVPTNTTFISATAPAGWTSTTPSVGGTGNVTFTKAAVANAEAATFEIVVQTNGTLADGTIITNTVDAVSDTPDGDTADNTDSETTTVTAPADLAVTKTDSPDPVVAGANITYTINLNNNGPNASNSVSVTDATPANTTFVSAQVTTGTGWTITSPPVGGTGNVTFTKASVANGETATFEIVVQVNAAVADGSIITNTVTAAATTLDQDPTNNTDTETTAVQARADLALTKLDSPDPVVAGTNVTYTIDFVNNGPSIASNVTVSDNMPPVTTFVSATAPAGWTSTTPPVGGFGPITFTKPTAAPGETAQFIVVLNVNAGVTAPQIGNVATAASSTQDDSTSNNTSIALTAVVTQADLSITKTDSPDPVNAGADITYTLNYNNSGPSDAQGVSITDATPVNTTFVSATAPAGWASTTPSAGGTGTVTFTRGTSPTGETAQFTIVVNVNSNTADASTISNTTDVTSATSDTNSANNSDTETTTVQTSADLSITKTDSPDPVAAGANITYTVDLVNNGPSDAQTVSITDSVPANTTFVSATAPAGWTSTTPPVGGTGTVVFDKATVTAGEAGQFTIVVAIAANIPDATVITNTATTTSDTTDPNTANNSATTTTTVNAISDLAVTKIDSQDPATAGLNLTYTITFANNGPSEAQNVVIADPTPANTTFVSATAPAGWTTTTPPVGGTGNITFTKATVAPAETATFDIVVNIDSATPDNTTLSNTVTVTSDSSDPDSSNDSATETTLVREPSDLSITKTDNLTDVSPGQSITYTIVAANNGRDDPAAVVVDDLPDELLNVTWSCVGSGGATCTLNGTGDINETVNLPDGGSVEFTINASIDFAATNQIVNTATITPGPGITDPDLTNNTATDTDTILCLFCDEFDDSTVNPNWVYTKSINPWSEDGNNLVGSSTGNTTAIAQNVFAGCNGPCTVFASMSTAGGQFSRISMFAWFSDKQNNVELVMRQDKGRWVLKHKVAGTVVAKANAKMPIAINTVYNIRITFTGTEFQVFIDGSSTPNITLPASQEVNGTIGFKVKETTGTFDFIRVF